jgi:HEAT repeat protein
MPSINPAVIQWIGQMADTDQVVAYYAYQCLREEVFHVSRPGERAAQTALANALGEALVAQAKPGQGAGSRGAASFRSNVFLTSAAKERAEPLYPRRVRSNLARLLGYLPVEAAVPPLAKALNDLEGRETARQALECNPSERATDALIAALNAAGPTFCVGVVNSLAKRKGERVLAALRTAAGDPQTEVRIAALQALADFPEPSHDAILEKATKAASARERRAAHVARARLARTLRASGNPSAADRICRAILSSDAPEPQKKAGRFALGIS